MSPDIMRHPLYEDIWQTVAGLEKQFYTRDEIAHALREVADEIETNT